MVIYVLEYVLTIFILFYKILNDSEYIKIIIVLVVINLIIFRKGTKILITVIDCIDKSNHNLND